jgi:PAS domain S-box-containing protein
MMWLSESDGRRTFFNQTWLAFTGRALAEEAGVGWAHGVYVKDRARCLAAYRKGVRSAKRFELEYRLRRSDGEYRHVLDRAAPRVEGGALIGFIGSCLDIQDRKCAELALRASEMRFRLLAENAPDVIFRYRVHPTFGTEYISPAAATICGRRPDEFLANPDLGFQLVHPEDRSIAMAMRYRPKDFKDPVVLRWLHPDGRVVWAEHRNTPIFDADGRLVAIEGIGRDITDRVAAEERLRESESQLRRLAAAVDQARENERTLIARELHDELGQSLTAIKLELARTAQALTRQRLAPEAIDGLQSIVGGIDVAAETVRRLATSLRPPALDHLGLVDAIELEAAALTRRSGIRSRVSGNRRLPPLDEMQTTGMFRIVQEALTNIVRHASASTVTISIVGSAKSTLVRIQDDGRGMTSSGTGDSTALGLLGMHERAEMIGATLTITSTPGKGTSVSLVLNRQAAARGKRRR